MKLKNIVVLLAIVVLTSCGGDSSSGNGTSAGSLKVRLTDAPIDEASNVFVSVRGISLNYEDGGWVDHDLSEIQKIDLLTLQSGETLTLFDSEEIQAGEYKVRLNLHSDDDNELDHSIVLTEGGTEYELFIPSGLQTGLKLSSPITVLATGDSDYTIDFNVRKSIVKRGQGHDYTLTPVLSLIDNSQVGSISGVFTDTTLFNTDCSDDDLLTHNAVYIYSGHDVLADDIGSNGIEPITTSPVVYDNASGEYGYTVAFLPIGDYTVSLTCNADLENIETNDELLFKASENQAVVEAMTMDES